MLCYRYSQPLTVPKLDHWTVVKNILKYFRSTRNYILVFSGTDLKMIRYIDYDFQADRDSRRSTSGSVFTLNEGSVV